MSGGGWRLAMALLAAAVGSSSAQGFGIPFLGDLLNAAPAGSAVSPQERPFASLFRQRRAHTPAVESAIGQRQKPFQLPTLQQVIGSDNFGIKQGPGCIPYVSSFIRLLWADCQSKADTGTLLSWGNQLNKAIGGRQLDLVAAAKQTCRLQSERQHCERLGQQVLSCDIFGSLQTATAMQQARQRCDQITALSLGALRSNQQQVAANQLLGDIGKLIGGEVAGSLLQNFLG